MALPPDVAPLSRRRLEGSAHLARVIGALPVASAAAVVLAGGAMTLAARARML